ncbi:MAG: sensor histidine kinase [Thermomicrobiales bacterium]
MRTLTKPASLDEAVARTHAPGAEPKPSPPSARATDQISGGLAAISRERTLSGVYRAACAQALRIGGVGGAAVLRHDDRGLLSAAYANPAGIPVEIVNAASASLHQRWIASHAPRAADGVLAPYHVDDRPEILIAPLVSADALLGGLLLVARRGAIPAATASDRVAVAAIGAVASQAIETIVLRQRLDISMSRADHERELTTARRGISRELHDGPTQDLALAGLTLDRLVIALGAELAISADARQARDLIDRAVVGMRQSIGKLRSTQPPAPSITGPLRELLAEMEPAAAGFEVEFKEVSGVRLAPEVERAMIGIVREALHNVRKHAKAESVRLEVRRVDGAVEIAVTDDGVGFQGDAPAGHFGLEQIRELAEETGGRIDIGPAPGNGTAVRAWIPLP